MSGSTITSRIVQTVTLGSGTYSSPLTITTTGIVAPTVSSAAGVFAPPSGGPFTLANSGAVSGYGGTIGTAGTVGGSSGGGGAGGIGIGVDFAGRGTITNAGQIKGGAGGTGGAGGAGASSGGPTNVQGGQGGTGGDGGDGILLAKAGAISNSRQIYGGAGGTGGAGGAAGIGGNAGAAGYGGTGGSGVELIIGSLTNSGSGRIAGGKGGAEGSSSLDGGHGGAGGSGIYLDGSGSVTNDGNVQGGKGGAGNSYGIGGVGGAGIVLSGTGVVTNEFMIVGGTGGAGGTGGTDRAGNYGGAGGAGVYLSGGTLIDSGTVEGGSGGAGFSSTMTGATGDAVQFGTASGLLVVDPGAMFIGNVVANSAVADTLELSGTSGAELSGIGTQFLNFNDISFATGAAWTIGGDSAGLASGTTIAGFTSSDTIDLTGFTAAAYTYVSGTGLVLSNATSTATIDLTGSFSTADFTISSDGANGTLIDFVNCFAQGTHIATADGDLPVESLHIGMEVKTLFGGMRRIKWIGWRAYAAPLANDSKVRPIYIKSGAITAGVPARDLLVSPGHAICIDNVLIHASRLVNGVSIFQVPQVNSITYFHVELDSHDVLFAENCPAETFVEERFRPEFNNAAEFHRLYPGQTAAETRRLPVLDQGFQLQSIRDRLAMRAGIVEPARPCGPLRGFVDQHSAGQLAGWAQDVLAPETPVCLDVFAGSNFVCQVLANLYRDDLRSAGVGSGCHAFTLAIPPGCTGPITVRRTADQATLVPTEAAMVGAA